MTDQNKTKEDTLQLAVLITPCGQNHRHSDGSLFYELDVVTFNEKGQLRNPSPFSCSDPFVQWASFKFRCFVTYDRRFSADMFYVEYKDLYSVNLPQTERMFKLLKKCQAVREKMAVTPQSFGQYVTLMATGLGIKTCIIRVDDGKPERSSYDENQHRFFPIREAARMVDAEIEKFRRIKFPEQEVA